MTTPGPSIIAQPVCIVLIEDNPGDAYLLECALKERGIHYEMRHFEEGDEALRAIAGEPELKPDLILVDLNLPGREGFDVLLRLRQNPRLVGIPVGAFTSSDAPKDKHRIGLIGVERYVHKPPTLEGFLSEVGTAVEEMLALRRSRVSSGLMQ